MYILQEDEGYCCLLIAILCDLDASEAQMMYKYGPDHPRCQKIKERKVKKEEMRQLKAFTKSIAMKMLREKGYSMDAISEAYGCYPSTVKRRLSKLKEKRDRMEG